MLSSEEKAGIERLQELAIRQLGEEASNAHFIWLSDGSLTDLLDILTDTHCAVLIVERDDRLLQSPSLKQSLSRLDCPLLVVR